MLDRYSLISSYLQNDIRPDQIHEWIANFSRSHVGTLFDGIPVKVALFCSSRSGSEFLADQLRRYGVSIEEHLNRGSLSNGATLAESDTEYLTSVLTEAQGASIGIKLTHEKTLALFASGELPERAGQWKFLQIKRRNRVAQAVSLVIADHTGEWRSDKMKGVVLNSADYNFDAIQGAIERICYTTAHNDELLGKLAIETFDVHYEDLVADPEGVAAGAARHLGFKDRHELAPKAPINHRKQATELNEEWELRYRRDVQSGRTLSKVLAVPVGAPIVSGDFKAQRLSNVALLRENEVLWTQIRHLNWKLEQVPKVPESVVPSAPSGPLPSWYYSRVRMLVPPAVRRAGQWVLSRVRGL